MKKVRRKVEGWARREAHLDTAVSHLLQFSFQFFSSELVVAITTILGTVVIAVMVGENYYGWGFWVAIVIYCILVLLSAWANVYVKQKIQDTTHFQNALRGIGAVLRAWAISMQKCAKQFRAITVKSNTQAVNTALMGIDFQTAAFFVCEKLSEFLLRINNLDNNLQNVYVTIYQRFEEPNGEQYCKMIAYSKDHEPTGYNQHYKIPDSAEVKPGEVELHSYIFGSGKTDVVVLCDSSAVQNSFKVHPGSEERECEVCQYIGIPIVPAGCGVTFLLQVDTPIPYLFGNREDAVREFANNTINPYAQFLHMIYEQGRTIEQMMK